MICASSADGRGAATAAAGAVWAMSAVGLAARNSAARWRRWRESIAGAEILTLPVGPDGRVDLAALLAALGERPVSSLLVEGGGEIVGSFIAAGLVDKLIAFVGPKIVGGAGAPSPVGGAGVERMADAARFAIQSVEQVGQDIMLTAYPRPER